VVENAITNRGQDSVMKTRIALAAPLLTAGLLGGLIAAAPVVAPATVLADGPTSTAVDPNSPISGETGAPFGDARDGTDPLVPYGVEPQAPVTPGYVDRNHDEGTTANGAVDLPF
jgi:hypothetical protein